MRASTAILVLGLFTSVICAPFETFSTGGFSNFDPNTGSFTSGTHTNLFQETSSSNADDFLLSFEKLFPGEGSFSDGAAFNPFASADGSCDEFCQKVLAIDTQSQAQFEQDFLSFQSQFGNSLGSGEEAVPSSQPTPGQRPSQPPRGQTQVAVIPSNSNSKPDENFKSNNNVQNKNFLFFGNNNKSPKNPPIQQQTVTKPPPTRSTTPFTVFTTTRRTTRPSRPRPTPTEEVKNSEVTARAPVTISVAETTARPEEETSSKKTTKIKWTYNGKTIGTSTITEKPPGEDSGDKLPVAPFFNSEQSEEGGRQQRGMEGEARRSEADFPVFDAVPS